ncbi:ABC-F family ATP-binding cassette domain-containing protein [Candidatus Similichlamydia epinepheli]|uniref:ABC-F family ATP-binding cassette domain-containing protein n=1 Tax=Candidatus Similichlamydia epinepheli TaxID=1903953 RepID=UPI000D3C4879|nr:ABC-F family ATP-binding cassette domain-containing protein [Candidatus Similichlamydia epinepheli]
MKGQAVVLENISMQFGGQILFEDVNLSFVPGNRYALTGPNGSGKSTLLKIIMKREKPVTGTISCPERIGMLYQNTGPFKEMTLKEVVIQGNSRLANALCEIDLLYEKENPSQEDGMRIAQLQDIICEEDGYSAEPAAESLLTSMQIDQSLHDQPLKNVPTDIQLRVLLCQALFGSPDALLLDEPTNFLDLETIGWLENFLNNYPGVVVLTSHDRHFLNSVATHVADIDYETVILYPGNYDSMVFAKTSARSQTEADVKAKSKKIAQLRQFVARFGAGTRASQVRSREREIERLQPEALKKSNIQRPYIRFVESKKTSGERVLLLEHVEFDYGQGTVLSKVCIEVVRGDRIVVIGNNGAGKTTLIKLLAGIIQPTKGAVELGHNVLPLYFPQNHFDAFDVTKGDLDMPMISWLRNHNPSATDQMLREALGRMIFSGDAPKKTIRSLSGGETARFILSHITLQEHNLLLLDEPNNHMDIESVIALTQAIRDYKGTVIVSSHDRDLIENVGTKVISIEKTKVKFFSGTFEEWNSAKKGHKNR